MKSGNNYDLFKIKGLTMIEKIIKESELRDWSDIPIRDKSSIIILISALFPQVWSKKGNPSKYAIPHKWLALNKKIISHNFRDIFSAGGIDSNMESTLIPMINKIDAWLLDKDNLQDIKEVWNDSSMISNNAPKQWRNKMKKIVSNKYAQNFK